jgi:3-deoxy-D-manno-octulosonate 8-phosphate phosphatase (KDO 8-P phosphatase)
MDCFMNSPKETITAVERRQRTRAAAASDVRLLVLDVDGVLTDGRLHFGPAGETHKDFHVRDGAGIKAVLAAGIAIAVISGRKSTAVSRRCRELGIRYVYQGVGDKAAVLHRLLEKLKLQPRQCASIGDDTPDIPVMQVVGLAVAVADAHPTARAAAHRRTRLPGGAGAVREVCDWLLAAAHRP